MEAKELMISDWVKMRLPNNSYTEVAQLESLDAVLHGKLIAEPITLTPEVLIANGFRFMESKRLVFIPDEGGFISYHTDTHYIDVSGDGCVKKNIGYINELQHALRLCGLNELADNFKV